MVSIEIIKSLLEKSNKEETNFYVKNHDHSFEITFLDIKKKNEYYKVTIYYHILPLDNAIRYKIRENFETTETIIQFIYEVLWTYKVCNECFNLMKNSDESICDDCKPQKFFWEFGLEKKYTESIPTCSICFDHTYSNKLQCGHYFHLTCFKNLYHDKNVKCPICRISITKVDRNCFFLEEKN